MKDQPDPFRMMRPAMKRKLFPVLLLIAAAVIFANAWWAFQSVNRLAINASWVAHS